MSKLKSDLLQDTQFHIEDTNCPRCGFCKALYQYNAFNCEDETIHCFRCGYESYSGMKLDHEGQCIGSEHRQSSPAGYLVCAHITLELTEDQIEDKAAWLRAEIESGRTNGKDAYLSRWNGETKQAELVVGKYPWQYT